MTVIVGAIRQVLATDPSQGIKAAAALREQMARDQITGAGPTEADLWFTTWNRLDVLADVIAVDEGTMICRTAKRTARYIAAEASPRLAITGAHHWQATANRHERSQVDWSECARCRFTMPCPDLTDTLTEVDAWLSSLEVTDS